MSWSTSELRVRLGAGLSPPVKYFIDCSKVVLLLWIFLFFLFCLVFAMSLCVFVYMCFVVTCWERADLLALVCGVYYEFVTFPLVSWVRCGTWLYRFLIFAPLLTLIHSIPHSWKTNIKNENTNTPNTRTILRQLMNTKHTNKHVYNLLQKKKKTFR